MPKEKTKDSFTGYLCCQGRDKNGHATFGFIHTAKGESLTAEEARERFNAEDGKKADAIADGFYVQEIKD